MQPKYFATPLAFRAWLETFHARKDELLVGFYKRDSGKASISWPESVDQALCFGWIDGVRKRIDEERYSIRFTPRRPTSIWSAVNIKRVAELTEQGHMQPAGRAAFELRTEAKSRIYAYENSSATVLSADYQKKLLANKRAWAFFQAQAERQRIGSRRGSHNIPFFTHSTRDSKHAHRNPCIQKSCIHGLDRDGPRCLRTFWRRTRR